MGDQPPMDPLLVGAISSGESAAAKSVEGSAMANDARSGSFQPPTTHAHTHPTGTGTCSPPASSSSILQASGVDEFNMLLTASPSPPRCRRHHSKGPCCGSTHQAARCCSLRGHSSSICALGHQHCPLHLCLFLPSRIQAVLEASEIAILDAIVEDDSMAAIAECGS